MTDPQTVRVRVAVAYVGERLLRHVCLVYPDGSGTIEQAGWIAEHRDFGCTVLTTEADIPLPPAPEVVAGEVRDG